VVAGAATGSGGMTRAVVRAATCALALGCATPTLAGPPYVTDDPEPTEAGHWEIYAFATGSHTAGESAGATGLDLNYGGAKDLQLTMAIPIAYEHAGGSTHAGLGVVELAAKYKILHQAEGTATPDVAVFPRLFLPTVRQRFGSDRMGLLLPVWLGKDAGGWSVFGGGGYQINPGAGNRDFWTGGIALSREVTERLSLGGEVYHHSADAADGKAFTGLNLGVTYRLNDHWSVLASGGPGIQNAREEGRYVFYASLKADY
jgi:hypothetical protein